MLSNKTVSEGIGLMVVLSVGVRSSGGKIQEILNEAQNEETPLQAKLKVVAIYIGKIGVAAGIITFLGLAIRWAVSLVNNSPVALSSCSDSGASNSATTTIARVQAIVEDFVVAITIIVVAVPEGLPLAVTLALSLSMFKMMRDKCFVRHLDASETMGQATTVCTDKTGTLTYNRMSVVRVLIGDHIYKGEGSGDKDSIPFSPKTFNGPLKAIICEGISVNSTCFIKNEDQLDDGSVQPAFVGSATEGALLMLARKLGVNYRQVRERIRIVENGVWSFSAERKRMSTLVRIPDLNIHRIYTKGASEIILGLCTSILDTSTMSPVPIKQHDIALIQKTIKAWASEGLRTFALAFRDVEDVEAAKQEEDPEHDLVFLALMAIKDPIRREIPAAVSECQRAGLVIRMVTGDNILTATKIAKECNIFHGDGIALEGPAFRAMSEEERIDILPRLQYELVSLLRAQGEVVAVTGDGTNDAPALKEADVGFSMGISGTQIALNASDIVLLDDNFASIVQAIRWGRNVLNTIRKFLQFQLGINLAAIIITFVGSIVFGQSPFSTVQLLWVNLIMDSFGALALASDDPDDDILDQPPQRRNHSIVSPLMAEYIAIQTVLQVAILVVVMFKVDDWVSADTSFHGTEDLSGSPSKRARTIVFTTFICLQITNLMCARQLNGELNLFAGFFRNRLFLMILFIIMAVQVLAITVGYTLFNATHLDPREWLVCIVLSLFNLPAVFIARVISKIYHASASRKNYGRVEDERDLETGGRNSVKAKSIHSTHNHHARIQKTAEDAEAAPHNYGGQHRGGDPEKQGELQRSSSIVEVIRKIKVDAPIPTKTRSQTSLNSSGSRGSRGSRK
nr:Calcium-transporting ATPase 10, plasma membrane-type [Polyrhizophydium stewartii]